VGEPCLKQVATPRPATTSVLYFAIILGSSHPTAAAVFLIMIRLKNKTIIESSVSLQDNFVSFRTKYSAG
jgi:hypothetical protein